MSSIFALIFDPSPSINYDFVAGSYLVASLVCLALAVASLFFEVSSVKGWWIALAPFPPSFLWSLVVRSRWQAGLKATAKSKAE